MCTTFFPIEMRVYTFNTGIIYDIYNGRWWGELSLIFIFSDKNVFQIKNSTFLSTASFNSVKEITIQYDFKEAALRIL